MSLKAARKFLTISRFGLPLATLYATGFAMGDAVYRGSGHLGLFYGPLGDLRRAVLGERRHYAIGATEKWAMLVPLAVWLFVLAVECRHQLRRARRARIFLLIGYLLGAISIVGPLLGVHHGVGSIGSEVLLGVMGVSGIVLAVGAWPDWGTRARVAAPLVCIAGVAMSLWAFSTEDRLRLRQSQQASPGHIAEWGVPCSRTRG